MHCYVKCVENYSRKKGNRKTHAKKAQAYFGSQSKISRFKTSFTKSVTEVFVEQPRIKTNTPIFI